MRKSRQKLNSKVLWSVCSDCIFPFPSRVRAWREFKILLKSLIDWKISCFPTELPQIERERDVQANRTCDCKLYFLQISENSSLSTCPPPSDIQKCSNFTKYKIASKNTFNVDAKGQKLDQNERCSLHSFHCQLQVVSRLRSRCSPICVNFRGFCFEKFSGTMRAHDQHAVSIFSSPESS